MYDVAVIASYGIDIIFEFFPAIVMHQCATGAIGCVDHPNISHLSADHCFSCWCRAHFFGERPQSAGTCSYTVFPQNNGSKFDTVRTVLSTE